MNIYVKVIPTKSLAFEPTFPSHLHTKRSSSSNLCLSVVVYGLGYLSLFIKTDRDTSTWLLRRVSSDIWDFGTFQDDTAALRAFLLLGLTPVWHLIGTSGRILCSSFYNVYPIQMSVLFLQYSCHLSQTVLEAITPSHRCLVRSFQTEFRVISA